VPDIFRYDIDNLQKHHFQRMGSFASYEQRIIGPTAGNYLKQTEIDTEKARVKMTRLASTLG